MSWWGDWRNMYRSNVRSALIDIFGDGLEGSAFGRAHEKWTHRFTAAHFMLEPPANPTEMFHAINMFGGGKYFDAWVNKIYYAPLSTGLGYAGDPRINWFAIPLRLRIGLVPVLNRLRRWIDTAKNMVRIRETLLRLRSPIARLYPYKHSGVANS